MPSRQFANIDMKMITMKDDKCIDYYRIKLYNVTGKEKMLKTISQKTRKTFENAKCGIINMELTLLSKKPIFQS